MYTYKDLNYGYTSDIATLKDDPLRRNPLHRGGTLVNSFKIIGLFSS